MRLVLTIPPHGARAEAQWIALREPGIDVGGASDCDAIVDHPSVGTARVRLERRGDDWVVIDREGRGVCSVGGVPLRAREPRIVRPPHAVRLGDVELALGFDPLDSQDGSTREVALRAAAFVAEVAPGRPRVRVVEGPRIGETLDLAHGRPYWVGRGKSCDLFLDADDASREHFAIEYEGESNGEGKRTRERVIVRDPGSARGTYLGRSRLVPDRGAVWDPSRMLRAADSVFSLEVATQGGAERLLAPLERTPERAPRVAAAGEEGGAEEARARVASPSAPDGGVNDDEVEPERSASDESQRAAREATEKSPEEPAASSATTPPTSSPVVEVPRDVPRAPHSPVGKPSRDPSFVIALLAAVIGVTAVGLLLALFLW